MGQNDELFKRLTGHFKSSYPALTAESMVAFMVASGADGDQTVGDIARVMGMMEPQVYQHLSALAPGRGVGLVTLINVGDGSNKVVLTPLGANLRDELAGIAQI